MTVEEFSDGFDTLVSSYRRFRDFDKKEPVDTVEFDEYEKSIYLTKAQEELVLSLYDSKNSFGDTFEGTEEMRRFLSDLVVDADLTPVDAPTNIKGVSSNSKFFHLPDDLWFITYEAAKVSDAACEGMMNQDVIPVRQDEYHKIKRNPFRGTTARRALRLDITSNMVEIVSKQSVSGYSIRYMKRLQPIILESLPSGLTIGGISYQSPCQLHPALHQRILEMAVNRALHSKGLYTNNENN